MGPIWIVSESLGLAQGVARPLRDSWEIVVGTPERAAWRGVGAPDLVVLVSPDSGGVADVERLLDFLAGVRYPRRPPVPALYIGSLNTRPSLEEVRRLIDDRPSDTLPWPPDPDRLVHVVSRLTDSSRRTTSLRERTRIGWVQQRVEVLYAGIDLPALRHAIDPRNASRPVLLTGERGTGRVLLARYIHQLAEPPRRPFVRITLDEVGPGELEEEVLGRTVGMYPTLMVQGLDRAPRALHGDLAELLTEEGGIALDTLRWIVLAGSRTELAPALREVPWITVQLPPLRQRDDLQALVSGLAEQFSARTGQPVSVSPETVEHLGSYGWPGNLRELMTVLELSLPAATDGVLEPGDLRLRLGDPPRKSESSSPSVDEKEPPEQEAQALPDAPPPKAPEAPTTQGGPRVPSILRPMAEEIRAPVRALRTYARLLHQRPDDPGVHERMGELLEGDLGRIEHVLEQVERFSELGEPESKSVNLLDLLSDALQARLATVRDRGLVVLEEPDREAPPARGDASQLRFAIDAVLDRALRMIPEGGDLYVGSRYLAAAGGRPPRHRILIRFHSPEEVLAPPDEADSGGTPLEIVMARALVERMGGTFAVDVSGPHDNLVLIELPS